MAAQFDATARINVDLRGFARAANEVTRSGGSMSTIFRNLHNQLNQLEVVEKKQAAAIRQTATAYNSVVNVVKNYLSVVTSLAKNEAASADGAKKLVAVFGQLRSALAGVQGLSQKEAERLGRTVGLYNQLASVLKQVADSYRAIAAVRQNDAKADQAAARAAQSAQRQAQATQRLAQEQQKLDLATQKVAQASQRLAQDQQRLEQSAQRTANAQQRLNQELRGTGDAMGRFSGSSFQLRSSLSEIEQAGRQLIQVFQAVGQALIGTAISQESAYAQVARVVGEAKAESAGLLTSFRQIAESFPITFEEVARIGQLGAQIGIAADELDSFTRTVAKFSLTTGVSVDQTTLLLGRIREMQDVPISEMENLGSAILALGTASAATDEEILRVNESIATVSNVFGLSAQAVSGLAAALATVRVRPELSRGSLTRVFGQLDKAISAGGESLLTLSKTMGMTAQETVRLRQTNPDEFFLAFVKGLKTTAGPTNNFQAAIRELGINAVRDIDTFTRLGNNFDILTESFARSNDEWMKGTELQRQSQGIFETTASRIQNLVDAFKTLLAIAGGPLAKALGQVASAMQWIIDQITNYLGPVVPIVGALTAVVVAGGIAWGVYQVILAKSIQSMIAMRELQRSLGVQTLGLGTAMAVYQGKLAGANAATASTVGSMRGLTSSAQQMSMQMNAAAASNTNFARSSAGITASTSAMATSLRASAVSAEASALANRNLALSTTQVAASQGAMGAALGRNAAQTAIFGAAQANAAKGMAAFNVSAVAAGIGAAGLNRSTTNLVPALTNMNTRMYQAVTAGNAMGAGMALQATRMQQLAVSSTAVAGAATKVSVAARAAAFAFGPWGIAIGVLAIAMGPLIGDMFDFTTQADKIAQKAIEAAGGTDALTSAIKADTAEFKKSGFAYRTITSDLEKAASGMYNLGNATIAKANAEKRSIELTVGSREELEKQANAHGRGADAARLYIGKLDQADKVIKATTASLKNNVTAIGENTQKWLLSAAETAASQSGIADGSEQSQKALEALGNTGVDVGEILTQAMTDPEGASKILNTAIAELGKTADNYAPAGARAAGAIIEQASAAKGAKEFLEALKTTIDTTSDSAIKNKTVTDLLGKSLTEAAKGGDVMRGSVKLTADSLEDLDLTSDAANEAITKFAKTLTEFGTPLDAFGKAAQRAFAGMKDGPKSAEDAMAQFSLGARGSLKLFLEELDKISLAQRNWAANLVKISATLGPDIANGLADLGPKAAPMLQELSNLTVGELQKLKPRLKALGSESIESLAAGIIAGQAQMTNVSTRTATAIANALSAELGNAKNTDQFLAVIKKYGTLIETLKKYKGEVNIDNVKGLKSIDDIIRYIEISQDKRLFDPKGRADLKTELFRRGALDLLSLIIRLEKEGAFDPNGKAKMDKSSFTSDVGSIRDLVYRGERNGWFNPDGKANLNQGPFNNGIAQIRSTARSTANYISNTLSTSATVRVGYYYYEKNNRPSTAYVKDGGWINGPGGPRDDKVPAMLSNGEFVINAAQAKRHGALLEAINSGRGGKGYSTGVKKMSAMAVPDLKPVTITSADMNKAMERALVQRLPSMSSLTRQIPLTSNGNGSVFNITNQYPQAEPTSVTINRSLAYAATISGVS